MQEMVTHFNDGSNLGLMDLTARKSAMDADLETQNWSSLSGLLIEFDRTFPIQCAAAWSPTEDLQGKYLQSLGNAKLVPEGTTISSFAADGKSYFLLSWLDDSKKVGMKLANSIEAIPDAEKAGALAAWLLLTSENCHLSPSWFESLDQKTKNTVNALMHPALMGKSAMSASKSVGIDGVGIASCRRIGAT
ncbi:hypothetical protein [Xanthomonas arboricola]|uniref:hypothetical protein n=1 Tax=Xanthomonas arboricola TaxID=56448 RepID=UPI0018459411|nr:hypothetical protein [Xanthomonas arboricola]